MQNSSNNLLIVSLLGSKLPFPIHSSFAHINNIAKIHLCIALKEAYTSKDISIMIKVNYASIFD